MDDSLLHYWRPHVTDWVTLIPFVCRIAAVLLAIPFSFCLALDLIAYGIARTLHLSMLQQRIPGSPIPDKRTLDASRLDDNALRLEHQPSLPSGRSSCTSLLSFSSSTSPSDTSNPSSPHADHVFHDAGLNEKDELWDRIQQ